MYPFFSHKVYLNFNIIKAHQQHTKIEYCFQYSLTPNIWQRKVLE